MCDVNDDDDVTNQIEHILFTGEYLDRQTQNELHTKVEIFTARFLLSQSV